MKAIAAVDNNFAIGRGNELLFRLKGDLAHFKAATLGGIVIMGRKTLESMPGGRPLPGRHTLVLSRTMEKGLWVRSKNGKNWLFGVFHAPEELLDFLDLPLDGPCADDERSIFVCGGEQVYRLMLPYCSELILTEVDAESEGADAHFPDVRGSGDWALAQRGEEMQEDGIRYRINRYERR
ncbi:MAG: dihydrofolate reductase [Clostridia bacterium]|nr:dihydrofolate reductase [Clostridia bacterium]